MFFLEAKRSYSCDKKKQKFIIRKKRLNSSIDQKIMNSDKFIEKKTTNELKPETKR